MNEYLKAKAEESWKKNVPTLILKFGREKMGPKY